MSTAPDGFEAAYYPVAAGDLLLVITTGPDGYRTVTQFTDDYNPEDLLPHLTPLQRTLIAARFRYWATRLEDS